MSETKSGQNTSESSPQEQYQVVALRYRPQAFADLVGQGHVAQALSNAIESNRVGHAYLFTGARGVGKTSSARIFAKCLNCSTGPTPTPCNECDICQAVSVGEDVDVLEIDGASNRGIDEIRQLRSNAAIRPGRGRYKIYIIDEVHMLTQQAFNALLKTLEEPPAHVKFIFCTTDPQKIPITVLSRCQRYDFSPVQPNEITNRLREIATNEGVAASEEALQLLARRANGSMRDSQSLLEQLFSFCGKDISIEEVHQLLGTTDIGRIAEIASAMTAHDATSTLNLIHQSVSGGVDAGQLTGQLLAYFRDMMAMHVGCGDDLLLSCASSDADALREVGKQLGLQTILNIVQIFDTAVVRMQSSLHTRTILEIAAIRVCNLEHLESIADLVSSLTAMPAGKAIVQASAGNENRKPVKKNEVSDSIVEAAAIANQADQPSPADQPRPATTASVKQNAGSSESTSSAPAPHISATGNVVPVAKPNTGTVSVAENPAASSRSSLATMTSPAVETVVAAPEMVAAKPAVAETKTEAKTETYATQPEAGKAESSYEPATAVGVSDKDRAQLELLYKAALAKLGDTTADMAANYESLTLTSPDCLEVALRDVYHHTTCSRSERKSKIEDALREVSGQSIRVQFTLSETALKAQEAVPVLSRSQQMRELAENDFVKDAIKIFNAQISDYFDPNAVRT